MNCKKTQVGEVSGSPGCWKTDPVNFCRPLIHSADWIKKFPGGIDCLFLLWTKNPNQETCRSNPVSYKIKVYFYFSGNKRDFAIKRMIGLRYRLSFKDSLFVLQKEKVFHNSIKTAKRPLSKTGYFYHLQRAKNTVFFSGITAVIYCFTCHEALY